MLSFMGIYILELMKNAISIDVEDWFCANNISETINIKEWEKCESRIKQNTFKILSILDKRGVKATFFVLGWIAERYPEIVVKISSEGHEIATHGYSHHLLTRLSPQEFEQDLCRSIETIGRYTDQEIIGFRAPSFSVTRKTYWALDILKKNKIKYDSSIFPVNFHPDYGIPDIPEGPHEIKEGLWEFPLSCFKVFGRNIPCSGGGYFRVFPYFFTRYGIRKCNNYGRPVIFYLHPWEVDPDLPRIGLSFMKKFRHYYNLEKTEERLERLLDDFEFTTIKEVLKL
jgi:polysaccharide deacetylase family protein (PEP-CTERM system associated)